MSAAATDLQVSREELLELLSPALGPAKAAEVIDGAVRLIAPHRATFTRDDALRILSHACGHGGIIGLAAHRARQRVAVGGGWSAARRAQMGAKGAASPAVLTGARIVELLASSLGQAKAQAEVDSAFAELGLAGEALSPQDAESVLGVLGSRAGVIGAAARLARVRLRQRA